MFTNLHESCEALHQCSKKELVRVKMEATVRRSVALILMKHNDYVRARKKLLEARTFDPGLEYIDELIKVCHMKANESEIEFKYTEMIRTLEPLSDREECHGFDWERSASLGPCGSVKPLDVTHSVTVNINSGATSQSSSGTKRIVCEESEKSRQGVDDCEFIAETQSPYKLTGKVCSQEAGLDTAESKCRLNEMQNHDPSSIPEDVVMDTVAAEFSNGACVKHQNSGSPLITSVRNPEFYTYSWRRHLSPRTCEEKKSQVDGTSKDENTCSDNLEMDGSSRETVGNPTAKNDEEKVSEEIDIESDGVSLGGFTVNVSEYGNTASHSDDAVNKMVDKEKVAEEIDTESYCVRLGGDDCELLAETESLNKLTGKVCGPDTAKCSTRSNEVERSLGRLSGSVVKSIVHKKPTLIFHDFSNHKKPGAFAVGQFLAVYDQEKMPRLYAQINIIESCYKKETNCTEYALYLRWLRPAPVNAEEIKWHDAGLPVSCGLFKLDSDKIDKCDTVVFSHLVSSFQEYRVLAGYSKELFELYPRKGEVWAIYKEWKPFDWCSDPKTRIGCKFQLVEILSNYSTTNGVKVAPVVKVAGYGTIFQRRGLYYQISARNLFRFSHNIPVRFAGYMRDLHSGKILDLDPLSIPDNVAVDAVAAEFSNGSSFKHQNYGFPRTSSVLNPDINTGNQYAGYVAPGNQNVQQRNTTSRLRLVSPRSCQVNKSQADGTSKCGRTSLNEMETSFRRSSASTVKSTVHKEPTLEFHDCSSFKTASAFTVGQFLAVYDQEKMPRLYAQIIGIESCSKQERNSIERVLYVRWLRPAPVNPDEKTWHEAGLPVSCGFFKLDSNKVDKCDAAVFSHLVCSFQEYHYSNNLFELYPQEGEVWALYKEWKPFHWCSDPKTRKGCKFLLVEILSDYSTATGVKVGSLVKVAGYRSIFRRSDLAYQIPSPNLFGFSHNISVRSAGDMKGLFSGTVLDLDPLSIPEDVSVDTVAAELSNGSSSVMHQNSGSSAITSMWNLVQLQQ
ncbi:hypothetical protein MKX03_004735 [Papaver bracteatum]|nr:hypothetical protein MKX03_004735 [Papaver bracteatum]